MKFKNIAIVVLFSVILLGFTGCGSSSSSNPASPLLTSTITGTIRNSQEVPIPGADVRLYKSEDAYKQSLTQDTKLSNTAAAMRLSQVGDNLQTRTDALGVYTFNNVPDGEYTLLAMAGNTIQYTQPGIRIDKTRSSLVTLDAQLTPTGNASGTVTLNGAGVGGLVLYLDKTSYLTITSSDGSFIFNNIPAGQTYTLKILEAPITGKSDEVFAFAGTNPTITIEPATTATTGLSDISLTTKISSKYKYAISGSVVNPNNQHPVANQIIIAINSTTPIAGSLRGASGTNTTTEIAYTKTQANGSYNLYLTTPGNYLVAVLSLDKNALVEPAMSMVIVASNNSVSDPAACETFSLSAGYKVSGVITSDKGTHAPGVNIIFSSLSPERFYSATSGLGGKYALYMPEGSYSISVSNGYEILSPSSTALTVSDDTSDINLTIQRIADLATPTFTVPGLVNDITSGTGIPIPNLIIQFTSTDSTEKSYFTVSSPNGDYTIDLPEGSYNVSVADGYTIESPISSITLSAIGDILIVPILLKKPAQASIVRLEGIISDQDDKKQSGIRIGFTNTVSEQIEYAISDVNGKYIINIPEGSYTLSSETDGYDIATSLTSPRTISSSSHPLGLDIEVWSPPLPPSLLINELSEITSTEQLQGFEAIGDYHYVVTTDSGTLNIRRYAYNSAIPQNTTSYVVNEFKEISTAVVGANLYVLVSACNPLATSDNLLAPYLLAYDQNLAAISNEPIELSYLTASNVIIDTSLFTFNNTLYYIITDEDYQTAWYQIPSPNYYEPGPANSYPDKLTSEMCQDGSYVYYTKIADDSGDTGLSVVRQSVYTGSPDIVANFALENLQPQLYQLSCNNTNLKLVVKTTTGFYTSEFSKTSPAQISPLAPLDTEDKCHFQQGYKKPIQFASFITYASDLGGLPLFSYPTKQYIPGNGNVDNTPITAYMNPFRKTSDRIYVIGKTTAGYAVISYDEASTAPFELDS